MSNLLDYIKWRGDIAFKRDSFCEIDALILSQISYLNFDGLFSNASKHGITIKELWKLFKDSPDFEKRSDLGMLINRDTVKVLEEAAESERFGNLIVCLYESRLDTVKEEQFAAVTYLLDEKGKDPFVVFRGTDDTIVGWKEDFNMALSSSVPAQRDAVRYINNAAKHYKGELNVAGHSKGGNLAVYAGAFIDSAYKRRLCKIYNFDGPGFTDCVLDSREYKNAVSKIESWYPYKSIVGMFFEHSGKYTVVESTADGVWQHDPFSWQIEGRKFITRPELDSSSITFNKVINTWIKQLSQEKIEKIIDALFSILESTGASTNSEIESDLISNSKKIIKGLRNVDEEIRDEAGELIKLLFSTAFEKSPFMK